MAETVEWHALSAEEVLATLKTDPENGLTSAEAQRRLIEYGRNELTEEKGASPLKLLVQQFTSVLMIILLVAMVLSAILGETLDALVIFVIVTCLNPRNSKVFGPPWHLSSVYLPKAMSAVNRSFLSALAFSAIRLSPFTSGSDFPCHFRFPWAGFHPGIQDGKGPGGFKENGRACRSGDQRWEGTAGSGSRTGAWRYRSADYGGESARGLPVAGGDESQDGRGRVDGGIHPCHQGTDRCSTRVPPWVTARTRTQGRVPSRRRAHRSSPGSSPFFVVQGHGRLQ